MSSIEVIAHSYNELLKLVETLQTQGKFSLPEASAIFNQLVQMKTAIEESNKNINTPGSVASNSSEELENLKVELMSTKIENDNLKRNYQEAVERIEELSTSNRSKTV